MCCESREATIFFDILMDEPLWSQFFQVNLSAPGCLLNSFVILNKPEMNSRSCFHKR